MTQDVLDFKTRTIMPDEDVVAMEAARPGYLGAALKGARADIYARLRKRYKTPMNPEPEIVVSWMTKLVTPEAYRARGLNPQDQTLDLIEKDRDRAYDQIKEAADAQDGLFDLPLLDATDASGILKGAPLGYSEPSPYDWTDVQSEALRGRA